MGELKIEYVDVGIKNGSGYWDLTSVSKLGLNMHLKIIKHVS